MNDQLERRYRSQNRIVVATVHSTSSRVRARCYEYVERFG